MEFSISTYTRVFYQSLITIFQLILTDALMNTGAEVRFEVMCNP